MNDSRWSYEGILPYFRKSERYHDPQVDLKQHGLDGPVFLVTPSSSGRNYALRNPLKAAWMAAGIQEITDESSGSPLGISEALESRSNGSRLIASEAYSLNGVEVMTETLVSRVLLEDKDGQKIATAVELADGTTYLAKREVILSAGAFRTPQVLLLSGIGPTTLLAQHGISQIVDAPQVGKNLFDHMGVTQYFRLRHPESGAGVGSPHWTDPKLQTGNPLDWVVCHLVPKEGLKAALSKDEPNVTDEHPLLEPPRCHVETVLQYAAAKGANPKIQLDGTHVSSHVVGMLPTSRGSITLQSRDPAMAPIIDLNYYATEADRYVMRVGLRKFMEAVCDTAAGQEMIISETVADGLSPMKSTSTDEEIDKRVFQASQ